MREPLLQLAAHRRVVTQEIARDEEEIEKIQPPGAPLQLVIALDDRPELVAQLRREVGAGVVHERRERRRERVAARAQLRFREGPGRAAEPGPTPMLAAAEPDQVRLESVVVAAA